MFRHTGAAMPGPVNIINMQLSGHQGRPWLRVGVSGDNIKSVDYYFHFDFLGNGIIGLTRRVQMFQKWWSKRWAKVCSAGHLLRVLDRASWAQCQANYVHSWTLARAKSKCAILCVSEQLIPSDSRILMVLRGSQPLWHALLKPNPSYTWGWRQRHLLLWFDFFLIKFKHTQCRRNIIMLFQPFASSGAFCSSWSESGRVTFTHKAFQVLIGPHVSCARDQWAELSHAAKLLHRGWVV